MYVQESNAEVEQLYGRSPVTREKSLGSERRKVANVQHNRANLLRQQVHRKRF